MMHWHKFAMMIATLVVGLMVAGCEIGTTTPEQEEQREFDRTMEQVGAPESLRIESDRDAESFESIE